MMKLCAFNKIVRYVHDLKLKEKMLLSFCVLIAAVLGVFAFYTLTKTASITEDSLLYSASHSFDQTHSFLSYKFHKIIKTLDIISVNRMINDILKKSKVNYSYVDQVQDMNDMKMYLRSHQDNTDIIGTRLYVSGGLLYSSENVNIFNVEEIVDTEWYKRLVTENNRILCCPSFILEGVEPESGNILSFARLIKNLDNYRDTLGIIRVDIDRKSMEDIISRANPTEKSLTYIYDAENNIVLSTNETLLADYKVNTKQIAEGNMQGQAFEKVQLNGNDFFIKDMSIPGTDWSMVTVIPYSEITNQTIRIHTETVVIILVLGFVTYVLAYYITQTVTKRISQLMVRVREAQHGQFNLCVDNNDKDEIGELIRNYNFMIEKISTLLEQQYKSGIELKNAELKALQSQIDPHFLYNTLDCINWLNQNDEQQKLNDMVKALAKFYRISLSKGQDIITIREEIKHAELYMQIQNIRFMGNIKFHINVDEGILDYTIPKITLQPIIENSIYHGILAKECKQGTITLEGRMENDTVVLIVYDDGIGIQRDILDSISLGIIKNKSRNGYGIANINQRIKLKYGDEYGLFYKSQYGSGTLVKIRIPPVMEDTEIIG